MTKFISDICRWLVKEEDVKAVGTFDQRAFMESIGATIA